MNGVKEDDLRLAILARASSCAARASSLSVIIRFIFSSIDGNFVCRNVIGMEIGLSPRMSLNGVCGRSACLRLLCVNSRVLRDLCQSSGWFAQ